MKLSRLSQNCPELRAEVRGIMRLWFYGLSVHAIWNYNVTECRSLLLYVYVYAGKYYDLY